MSGELFYGVGQWLIAFVMMALLILVTEAGFRARRKVRSRLEETANAGHLSVFTDSSRFPYETAEEKLKVG
jgi:hypothetical protein